MATAGTNEEVDFFRDTLARYFGYANELGESFRPLVPRLVAPSYGVAFLYVLGDTVDKGSKAAAGPSNGGVANAAEAADRGQVANGASSVWDSSLTRLRVADACGDTLLWQTLASVAIPGLVINRVVAGMGAALHSTHAASLRLPAAASRWLPTAVGLAMIPLIIHPIDALVDTILDNSTRPYMRTVLREAEAEAAGDAVTVYGDSTGAGAGADSVLGAVGDTVVESDAATARRPEPWASLAPRSSHS